MLGRSAIKWRLCSDMAIAADWDVKLSYKSKRKTKAIGNCAFFLTLIMFYCKDAVIHKQKQLDTSAT